MEALGFKCSPHVEHAMQIRRATLFFAFTTLCTLASWLSAARAQHGDSVPNPANQDQPAVNVEGDTLRYVGKLNAEGLTQVRAHLQGDAEIRVLKISSTGGAARDAIAIAELIHARGMAVIVEDRCNSACANYLFAPAKRATIADGAMVIWHHSCPQNIEKRFQFLDSAGDKAENVGFDIRVDGRLISDQELKAMSPRKRQEVKEKAAREFHALTEMTERFFAAHPGLDQRIVCLGDYVDFPQGRGYAYTMSVEDMKQFGVCVTTAPEDYVDRVRDSLDHEGKADLGGVIRLSDYPRFTTRGRCHSTD